jgi:hypothetical protein
MQGSTLSRPTWDRDGNVLVADFGRGVWSVPVTGKRHRVTLGSNSVGSEAAVRQVAVAPDGSRVALVMSTGTGDVVALGVLSSTKGGFTISGVHRIEDSISGVRDVVWSGPLTVAVLGSQGAGSQMLVVNVGSSAVTSSNVPTGTQSLILDNAGNPYVAVSNSEGSAILKRGYGRWATISEGVAVGLGP